MPYMCSKSAIFLESNNTNGEGSALRNTWQEKKNLCTRHFFLEIEVEQFFMSAICNAAISRNRIKILYAKNTTRNTIHSFQTLSVHGLRGRHKKGRGRGEGEKRQRGKGRELSAVSSLSPQSPSLFPFLPIPYPFRHLLRRPQHTPSQVLSPTMEEWSRFFPKQVHHK